MYVVSADNIIIIVSPTSPWNKNNMKNKKYHAAISKPAKQMINIFITNTNSRTQREQMLQYQV